MIIKLPYIKSAGEVHAASAAITAKKKMQAFTQKIQQISQQLQVWSFRRLQLWSSDTPFPHWSSDSDSSKLCNSLYIFKPYTKNLQAQHQGWN